MKPDVKQPEKQGITSTFLMERLVLLTLFVALMVGVVAVLLPFAVGLMFGGIIAIAGWPLRQTLVRMGLRPGWTAAVLVLLLMAAVVGPLLIMTPGLVAQLDRLFEIARVWVDSAPSPPGWITSLPLVGESIRTKWLALVGTNAPIREVLSPFAATLRAGMVAVAKGMGESLIQLILAVTFAAMFWMKGDVFSATLVDLLDRLGGSRLADMARIAANAVRGVFYGVVGTAAIQAILMTLGLLVAGVPGAAPLGFVTLLLALSQIGALLINVVWAGAVYWLYLQGQTGIILWLLAAWGIFIVAIDNVLKPLLIGASITMPMPLIIVGVFGGFLSFGFLGLFIGPVLIAVAYALVLAWRAAN